MNLSQNFTLQELIHSDTANAYKINNTPSEPVINNLKALCLNVLQPLRNALGCPIIISSGFRCAVLNKKVGGTAASQHLYGQAADITVTGQSNTAVFNWIRKNCDFDQLILENVNGVEWVHVSYNFENNRKQCLSYDGRSYKSI